MQKIDKIGMRLDFRFAYWEIISQASGGVVRSGLPRTEKYTIKITVTEKQEAWIHLFSGSQSNDLAAEWESASVHYKTFARLRQISLIRDKNPEVRTGPLIQAVQRRVFTSSWTVPEATTAFKRAGLSHCQKLYALAVGAPWKRVWDKERAESNSVEFSCS